MSTVRIAFIGVGGMGQSAHLRNYVIEPGVEVVAIAEPKPELRRRVAARYGIARSYADHRALLAAERPDALVCIQPFGVHGRLLPEVLAARVPVLIEKPIGRTIAAGERVLAASRAAGAPVYVGYHKRSDPATMRAVETVRALRASGELGPLRMLRVTMPPGDWIAQGHAHLISTGETLGAIERDPDDGDFSAAQQRGYDAFVNYYIHQVNLIRHLLGEEYRAVYADAARILLVGRSTSGVTISLEMAPWNTTTDWQESAVIGFERGWVRLELPAPLSVNLAGRLEIFRDPGAGAAPTRTEILMPRIHAMRQQARNLIAALRGEPHPLCGAEEALQDLRVARDWLRLHERSVAAEAAPEATSCR